MPLISHAMPATSPHKRLENLVWVLIYGGLLTLIAGLVVRDALAPWSHAMVVGGAVVAAVGVGLIFVRARRRD